MRARRRAAAAALLLLVVLAAAWWVVRGTAQRGAARSEEAIAAVRAWQPGGLDGVTLGRFVDDTFSGSTWSASEQPDGSFEVCMSYVRYAPWSDKRSEATWRYQAASGVVAAVSSEAKRLTDEAASRKW